jgi:2Fe-2S iron-sulfur cluster binding domain
VNTGLDTYADEDIGSFCVLSGYGSNLRVSLQSLDVKVYDERTPRFDAPSQTEDCGGEGICGTCLVQILSGSELLNPRVRVEDGALKAQLAPENYRWACRVQVAPDPTMSGTLKIKLRPQSAHW